MFAHNLTHMHIHDIAEAEKQGHLLTCNAGILPQCFVLIKLNMLALLLANFSIQVK